MLVLTLEVGTDHHVVCTVPAGVYAEDFEVKFQLLERNGMKVMTGTKAPRYVDILRSDANERVKS